MYWLSYILQIDTFWVFFSVFSRILVQVQSIKRPGHVEWSREGKRAKSVEEKSLNRFTAPLNRFTTQLNRFTVELIHLPNWIDSIGLEQICCDKEAFQSHAYLGLSNCSRLKLIDCEKLWLEESIYSVGLGFERSSSIFKILIFF